MPLPAVPRTLGPGSSSYPCRAPAAAQTQTRPELTKNPMCMRERWQTFGILGKKTQYLMNTLYVMI